jgi:hypothetical protein
MPEDLMRRMVAETVEVGKQGGGFILCPTATLFGWPYATDRERDNWLALLDVGLKTGAY